MADILAEAAGAPQQACITSDAFTGPLQQYVLPQLTPDALIVLRTTCKTLHQLITTAPFTSLQRTLQTLLPPEVKHCATDSQSLGALLEIQRALQRCLQAGAEARLQMLSLPELATPGEYQWERASSPLWALESPCRRLVLDFADEDDNNDQVLMDPCELLTSLNRPAVGQPTRGDDPFLSFLKGGALMESDSGLAILDMDTQKLTSTWKCPDTGRGLHCEAGLDSGLIYVSVSSCHCPWLTGSVAVLEQSSLQELLVIEPPCEPCQGALALSRPPATVECHWFQPSPDEQHIALWWFEATDRSYSRLRIYSLLSTKLVADINCLAVFVGPEIDRYNPEWSPDSKHIMFPAFQHGSRQHPPDGIMIANVSGSYRMLAASLTSPQQVSSWSANGQYIYIESSSSSNAQPDLAQSAGSVWRVQTGEEVLSWENHRGPCRAVWSPVGSSILLPDLTLMILPADGSSAEVIRHTLHRPQCFKKRQQASGFQFSASGSTLVGAWHTDVTCSPYQSPQALWHADCAKDLASPMNFVAADASGWLTASILWNPSPWAAHLYAIATANGRLYLIDAAQHKPLCSWSRTELVGSEGRHDCDLYSLSWSPDGSQLLVLGCSCISLLTFGPAASHAREDAMLHQMPAQGDGAQVFESHSR